MPDGSRATSSEVARRAQAAGFHVSRSYIGQLRKGTARNPAFATIRALATVFKVDANYFFGDPLPQGAAYEIAESAADDPKKSILSGLGAELTEEELKQVANYGKFISSQRRTGSE